MDVDDKTRFIFPASNDGKDASVSSSEIDEGVTVLSPSLSHQKTNSSYFSTRKDSPEVNVTRDVSEQEDVPDGSGVRRESLDTAQTIIHRVQDGTIFSSTQRSAVDSVGDEVVSVRASSDSNQIVINNRFEIMDLLGVGGMGAVYKATDRRKLEANDNDPYVAIKVLNDDFKNHPDAFISLQREARKSQTLAHPNIVNVHDFDRDGAMVFMTMEYLEGSPLDVLLREKAGHGLPKDQAKVVFKDISNALIYAHSHHIVHSDFKPGNIFVTNSKGAKVFDFGISRAVNPAGTFVSNGADEEGTTTVFDAGSLGALTPAYASLEMLLGKEPSPSDDVYALGCVAYELFCGRHPFNKVPADKAWEQKLQPKKIKGLSRREWKALARALQLTREKRTPTVDELVHQFFSSGKYSAWLILASVASLSIAGGFYGIKFSEKVVDEQEIKEELQVELQQELIRSRISDKEVTIERMLAMNSVSENWEADVRQELEDYHKLAPDSQEFISTTERVVATRFLNMAVSLMEEGRYIDSEAMLLRSEHWGSDTIEINKLKLTLKDKVESEQRLVLEAKEAEAEKLREHESRAIQLRNQAIAEQRNAEISAVLATIETELRCSSSMSIDGGLGESLKRLARLEKSLYDRVVRDAVDGLKECFVQLEKSNPNKAESLLVSARVLFPEQAILQDLRIDHCVYLKPGSGSRGARFSCQDKLVSGGLGPRLVVISSSAGQSVAMGKYEVSEAELSEYCRVSDACKGFTSGKSSMPAHNLSDDMARKYLQWLSDQSGHTYRLPREVEWLSAANPEGQEDDPDRNCHLRFGAIQKGDELVAIAVGQPNAQGLVNQVGNVQELALTSQGELVALGGSRKDSMSRCLSSTRRSHDGTADETTGFRVVRELKSI